MASLNYSFKGTLTMAQITYFTIKQLVKVQKINC